MSRALPGAHGALTPWIESLILSYGEPQDGGGSGGGGGQLKAHVTGVGQISASQAQSADGPTGVLYLSDGAAQIPAVLTAAAWERLQEQEDRECFASLLNATVCVRDSRLLFHMHRAGRTRCRFYLSVGELATTAAGPVRDGGPCCTALPAVQSKIGRTWRALLGRDESPPPPPHSQELSELSELLGAWRDDCLQALLDAVGRRLAEARERPGETATRRLTGWDEERVRFKTEEAFSVPVGRLLIPEEQPDGVRPEVDEAERRAPAPGTPAPGTPAPRTPAPGTPAPGTPAPGSPAPGTPAARARPELEVAGETGRSSFNPCDTCPPLCLTTSSPDATPPGLTDAAAAERTPAALLPSVLPPYQKPPASDARQGAPETPSRKRKRSEGSAEAPAAAATAASQQPGDAGAGSPPSWLFGSPAGASGGSGSDGDPSPTQTTTTPGNARRAHGDGTPFCYSYPPAGQNLLDLSRLSVAGSLLQWAARYLLAPTGADGRRDAA